MLISRNSWPALEILKALAIASMIFVHSWGQIVTPQDLVTYKEFLSLKIANILHFFCFFNIWIPAIAGSSLRLQCSEEMDINISRKLLRTYAFRWGMVLIFAGCVFFFFLDQKNFFLFYNPLHFIGGSFLVISLLLLFTPASMLWGWSALFFLFSIWGDSTRQSFISNPPFHIYQSPETAWLESLKIYVEEIIFGSSTIGWSFLPWIVSVLLGFSLVDQMLKSQKARKQLIYIAIVALVTVVLGLSCPKSIQFIMAQTINDQYTTLAMPLSLFIATTVGYLLFFASGTLFYQRKGGDSIPEVLCCLSRGSFWIFFLEFPLLRVFGPFFEPLSFALRIFVFPIFILFWSIMIGALVIQVGKKKLKVSLVRKS